MIAVSGKLATHRTLSALQQVMSASFEMFKYLFGSRKRKNMNVIEFFQNVANEFNAQRAPSIAFKAVVDYDGLSVLMDRAALTQIVSLLLDGAQRAVGETGFVHLLVTANASGKFAVRVSDSRHSCSFDLVTFTASSHAHDASLPDDMKTLKNLVASNNGKIFARTLENFGTTILVEFDVGVLITTPFKPMSLLPTIPDEAVFVPSDVVLLLDDNKDILNFLKKWIESIGLKALTFEKSFDAISHVERHRPDLKAFVIDVSLPAVDGIDTAKIFTQHAKYRRLPFLFSTGYSMERVASRLTHFERASVLQKPISREEFIEHFNTFVNATSN